jgi:prefoldin subunit 5
VQLLTAKIDERLVSLEAQLEDLQTTISELKEIKKLADERLVKAG